MHKSHLFRVIYCQRASEGYLSVHTVGSGAQYEEGPTSVFPAPPLLFSLRCTGGHCDFWDALSHRIFLTFVWTSVFWCVHCHWLRQSIYLNSNLYFYHRYHCNNGKWIWCCTLIAILAVICVPQGSRLQHINYSHEKHKRIGTCFQGYQNY